MKMLKIAAIVTMLLAPATFGAVTFSLTGPGGSHEANVPAGGTIDLNLNVGVGDEMVNGVSLYLKTDKPGSIAITNRVGPTSTVWTTYLTNLAITKSGGLDSADPKDVGAYNADGDETNGDQVVGSLTFQVLQANYPIVISLKSGAWSNGDASAGGTISAVQGGSFTIVPEPASMMLLAAGAAFFARRRRTA
jgi:hypothetical protein